MSDYRKFDGDEFQKQMSEFLRGQMMKSGSGEGEETKVEKKEEKAIWETFTYRPKEVKVHLDRYVICQDEAKKALAIAVCDHYNHIRYEREWMREHAGKRREMEHAKQNVLLLGPTGVGKTYLVRHIAELVGVPFVKADATKFSETGYIGGDVDDLVRELVKKADGDVELAEYGIIYLDEVDKIASQSTSVGRDVSGRGVQSALLKLMEETEVSVRNPMDIQGQLQAALDLSGGGRRGGKPKKDTISTRNILFIVSGAFRHLREAVEKRIGKMEIGFGGDLSVDGGNDGDMQPKESPWMEHLTTTDFVDAGFEPEFIGRLPIRVALNDLSADDLYEILRRSEGSLVYQYERAFRAYDIELVFEENALRRIAALAAEEKTGARGLMTICERVLRDFKFELPDSGVRELVVTEKLVNDPKTALQQVLLSGRRRENEVLEQMVREYAQRFSEKNRVDFSLEEGAIRKIAEQASASGRQIREVCEALFKDFSYGVRLLKGNRESVELKFPENAVENPDGWLSEQVLQVYRQNSEGEPEKTLSGDAS